MFQKVLLPAGVSPRDISQVQLTEAIMEMVKAGIGVSALARWAVAPQLESGALRAVPLTRKGLFRQWSAAMIRSKSVPTYLLGFVNLLAKQGAPAIDVGAGLQTEKRRRAAA